MSDKNEIHGIFPVTIISGNAETMFHYLSESINARVRWRTGRYKRKKRDMFYGGGRLKEGKVIKYSIALQRDCDDDSLLDQDDMALLKGELWACRDSLDGMKINEHHALERICDNISKTNPFARVANYKIMPFRLSEQLLEVEKFKKELKMHVMNDPDIVNDIILMCMGAENDNAMLKDEKHIIMKMFQRKLEKLKKDIEQEDILDSVQDA